MINKDILNSLYIQNLEENIINYISQLKNISIREAVNIYYKSKLSEQIEPGLYDIENMDFKYLALDLIENESELFINNNLGGNNYEQA